MKGILMLFKDPDRTSTGDPRSCAWCAQSIIQQRHTNNGTKSSKTCVLPILPSKSILLLDLLCGLTCDIQMKTHYTAAVEESRMPVKELYNLKEKQESDENLNIYLYTIQDAQINFEDGRFKEVVY